MSTKALLTETTELVVESKFPECSGLTVGHLRAFIEGANTAGLGNDAPVQLEITPQSDKRIIDVFIVAAQAETTSKDLEPVEEGQPPVEEEPVA